MHERNRLTPLCTFGCLPRIDTGFATLAELPLDPVCIECQRCNRFCRYRKSTLIQVFGRNTTALDVLARLADCPRRKSPGAPCEALFVDLAVMSRLAVMVGSASK